MMEPSGDEPSPGLEAAVHRRHDGTFRWEQVEMLAYKQEGSAPFRDVTRQVLINAPELACELRYFEIAPGGYSTLECHEHVHGVMILRGRGSCLVDATVLHLDTNDLVRVPPMTWHQFRAGEDEAMGFLCMVNTARDRPILPTEEELSAMRQNPVVAAFIRH